MSGAVLVRQGGGVFVPGIPRPQGSKRKGRGGQLFESSKYVAAWRADVKLLATGAVRSAGGRIEDGPVRVQLEFIFPRPKRKRDTAAAELRAAVYKPERPDIDKLARAVLDALEGTVYKADAQVCELELRKLYGNNGADPGVAISWRALKETGAAPRKRPA